MRYILILFIFFSLNVHAEIYHLALPSDSGFKLYWWPVLPDVAGWHHDRYHSIQFSANTQAPDGYTFENAETVIYAKAAFKPRVPDINSLKSFIENDLAKFKSTGDVVVKKTSNMLTSDGVELESFTFFPTDKGNWEQVAYGEEAYGEEGDYFVVFTISSRSKDGFEKSWSAYEQFVKNYKK